MAAKRSEGSARRPPLLEMEQRLEAFLLKLVNVKCGQAMSCRASMCLVARGGRFRVAVLSPYGHT